MTEIEILARAQMYLEKLANGIDPLTNKEVPENDVVNNVRISRCLFYSSGITFSNIHKVLAVHTS